LNKWLARIQNIKADQPTHDEVDKDHCSRNADQQ
jgi:hypothetical protein